MLALGDGTAVQAVVGSIVYAFRRLKKRRSREISARGYALHSVCSQLSFIFIVSKKRVQYYEARMHKIRSGTSKIRPRVFRLVGRKKRKSKILTDCTVAFADQTTFTSRGGLLH